MKVSISNTVFSFLLDILKIGRFMLIMPGLQKSVSHFRMSSMVSFARHHSEVAVCSCASPRTAGYMAMLKSPINPKPAD